MKTQQLTGLPRNVCTHKIDRKITEILFLPVHWDVEHVSGAHDSLIANNIFKIWKLLIVWIIKINL